MAIDLKNKSNVNAPDSTWLYGDTKDNTGSNNGTPINRATMTDYFQYFARMFAMSGLTFNGLFDNDVNGWQYFEALKMVTRGAIASIQISASALMSTYTAAFKNYTLSQLLFEVAGTSAGITFTLDNSSNLLDGTLVSISNTGDYSVTVARSGSDTIHKAAQTSYVIPAGGLLILQLDKGNTNWIFKTGGKDFKTIGAGMDITLTNSWVLTTSPKLSRDRAGRIKFTGSIQRATNFGVGGTIMTLPVGYRPTSNQMCQCYVEDSAANTGVATLLIDTSGAVTIIIPAVGVGSTTNYIFMNGITFDID